jgi:hypothetical protein
MMESTTETFNQLSELESRGLILPERLVAWTTGMNMDEAKAEVDAARKLQPGTVDVLLKDDAPLRADMVVLLVSDDDAFNAMCYPAIEELFEQYIEDENGDGEISVDVYYIPASEEAAIQSGYTGDSTKLFAEFQVGQSLLVISDTDADAFIVPDSTLDDLEPKLGMYEQTEGFRFYLHDTDFAEAVGWEEPLDEDIYIGIRKVKDSFSFKEEMQKNYEIAFPALQKFAEEFGTVAE